MTNAALKTTVSSTFEPIDKDALKALSDKGKSDPKAEPTTDVLDHFSFELKLLTKLRPDIPLRKRRCASST